MSCNPKITALTITVRPAVSYHEPTVTINKYLEDLKSLFLSTQIFEKGNTDEAFSLEIDGNLEVYIAVNPRLVI